MSNPNLNGSDMLEKYPELYEQTLYAEDSMNGMFKKKKK